MSPGPFGPRTDNADDQSGALANEALSWSVLRLYLDYMGPWYYWVGFIVAFSAESIAIVATNSWIRTWSSAYHQAEKVDYPRLDPNPLHSRSLTNVLYPNRIAFENWHSSLFSNMTFLPDISISYYLGIYVLLAIIYVLAFVLRSGLVFKGSLNASRNIHRKLLASVLGAQFRFFDTTPVGQITNR
jgi:ABC-type multidrug transport system fused ATPase/permease subunit